MLTMRPVSPLDHSWDHSSVAVEHAVAVDREHASPFLIGHVGGAQRVAADSGRADKNVDTVQFSLGSSDRAVDLTRRRNVSVQPDRVRAEFGNGCGRAGLVVVDDSDAPSGANHELCTGEADAAGSSGHECRSAGEVMSRWHASAEVYSPRVEASPCVGGTDAVASGAPRGVDFLA